MSDGLTSRFVFCILMTVFKFIEENYMVKKIGVVVKSIGLENKVTSKFFHLETIKNCTNSVIPSLKS